MSAAVVCWNGGFAALTSHVMVMKRWDLTQCEVSKRTTAQVRSNERVEKSNTDLEGDKEHSPRLRISY